MSCQDFMEVVITWELKYMRKYRMFDWVIAGAVLVICCAAGWLSFQVLGLFGIYPGIHPELPLPLRLVEYVVYGTFPLSVLGVLLIKAIFSQWIWQKSPVTLPSTEKAD